jgi:1-aminocyclopropane-1-carboxylate deaminase/D-cysteine desulfhydrase-like pyridoxal-dependent ACC family enzyme
MNEVYDNVKCGTWVSRTANIDYLVVAGGGAGGGTSFNGGLVEVEQEVIVHQVMAQVHYKDQHKFKFRKLCSYSWSRWCCCHLDWLSRRRYRFKFFNNSSAEEVELVHTVDHHQRW